MLKFYYNGIKSSDREGLQRAFIVFSIASHNAGGKAQITIYARDYKRFSKEVCENFDVKNETDSMVDYFDFDKIYISNNNHPLINDLAKAIISGINKNKYTNADEKKKLIEDFMQWKNH